MSDRPPSACLSIADSYFTIMLARALFVKRELGKFVVLFRNRFDNLDIVAYYFGMETGDEQFASKEEALRTSMQAGSVFLPNDPVTGEDR